MSAHVHLWLIDPVTDEVIRELSSVDAVTAADIANGVYNLAATYDDGTVGSVDAAPSRAWGTGCFFFADRTQ